MGSFSCLIYVISRIYFLVITTIFGLVNHFKIRKRVPATNDSLLLLSATEAVRKIAKREITSQQLVGAYVHRIEQVNGLINAVVIKLFNEATRKAEEIDNSIAGMDDYQLEELTKSRPLLGVPFTVKDSLEVDGQVITCGIYAQKGIKRTATAEVIKRMQAAGAILIAI
ncbi:Fatty-acid amide hydrolase 2, partial [Trichostrongylus colubriformis]